jgi:hypothetical protein
LVPLLLSALWLASAVLFRLSGHVVSSGFAAALVPMPVALAVLLRRVAVRRAARRHRHDPGVPLQVQAADLPAWPVRALVFLAIAGILALFGAIWGMFGRAPLPPG